MLCIDKNDNKSQTWIRISLNYNEIYSPLGYHLFDSVNILLHSYNIFLVSVDLIFVKYKHCESLMYFFFIKINFRYVCGRLRKNSIVDLYKIWNLFATNHLCLGIKGILFDFRYFIFLCFILPTESGKNEIRTLDGI